MTTTSGEAAATTSGEAAATTSGEAAVGTTSEGAAATTNLGNGGCSWNSSSSSSSIFGIVISVLDASGVSGPSVFAGELVSSASPPPLCNANSFFFLMTVSIYPCSTLNASVLRILAHTSSYFINISFILFS